MSRAEFHRRYSQHPEIKKAELVEGVVHLPSPVSLAHSRAHGLATVWLSHFVAVNRSVEVFIEPTILLDLDNEPQPDIVVRRLGPSRGEQSTYVDVPPDLVVEISGTTVSYDLHAKNNAYRRNGVQEYIVWRVLDEAIDWFALVDGEYQPLRPDPDGVIHSEVFPGLRLAVAKLLEGDLGAVLAEQSS